MRKKVIESLFSAFISRYWRIAGVRFFISKLPSGTAVKISVKVKKSDHPVMLLKVLARYLEYQKTLDGPALKAALGAVYGKKEPYLLPGHRTESAYGRKIHRKLNDPARGSLHL